MPRFSAACLARFIKLSSRRNVSFVFMTYTLAHFVRLVNHLSAIRNMAGNTGNGALGDRALPRNHRQTGSLRGRAGSPSTPLRMKSYWILTSVRGDSVTRTRDAGVVRRGVGGVVAGDTSDPVEPFRVSRSCGVPAADRTRRDAASTPSGLYRGLGQSPGGRVARACGARWGDAVPASCTTVIWRFLPDYGDVSPRGLAERGGAQPSRQAAPP